MYVCTNVQMYVCDLYTVYACMSVGIHDSSHRFTLANVYSTSGKQLAELFSRDCMEIRDGGGCCITHRAKPRSFGCCKGSGTVISPPSVLTN